MSAGFLESILVMIESIRRPILDIIQEQRANLNDPALVTVGADETQDSIDNRADILLDDIVRPILVSTQALSQLDAIHLALSYDENVSHKLTMDAKSVLMSRLMVIEDTLYQDSWDPSDWKRSFEEGFGAPLSRLYAWAKDHGLAVSTEVSHTNEEDNTENFNDALEDALDQVPAAAAADEEKIKSWEAKPHTAVTLDILKNTLQERLAREDSDPPF